MIFTQGARIMSQFSKYVQHRAQSLGTEMT